MTIGQAITQACVLDDATAVDVGAWCRVDTNTARRWMSDVNKIPGEALEILRQKLPSLPALLAERAVA